MNGTDRIAPIGITRDLRYQMLSLEEESGAGLVIHQSIRHIPGLKDKHVEFLAFIGSASRGETEGWEELAVEESTYNGTFQNGLRGVYDAKLKIATNQCHRFTKINGNDLQIYHLV